MIFNSLEFGLFFSLVLGLYGFTLNSERFRDLFLLAASYIFYSAWYWEYSLLIFASTFVDYLIGTAIHHSSNTAKSRYLLIISLSFNLGLLCVFKYFNFFVEIATSIPSIFGLQINPIKNNLLLPIGISFYTFQTLSYTLDIYRGKIQPEQSFVKFAVFVSFFPQLVAGPIVRAADFLPQLHRKLTFSTSSAKLAIFIIFSGLIKKILIADSLALMAVDPVFNNPERYSSFDLLMSLYAYAMQIYCDFSGYSDVAVGVALLLGFCLPNNFNRPYLAIDPSDFWNRWHITLSSWLRDYLYIPLGGSKDGNLSTYKNIMLTMMLGGLWHGASMNFILWGAFHGLILIAFRPFRDFINSAVGLKKIILISITFHCILFGWLLFRVPDLTIFYAYAKGIALMTGDTQLSKLFFVILLLAFIWHFIPVQYLSIHVRNRLINMPSWLQAGLYACVLILFSGMTLDTPNFLYFQF